MPWPNSDVSITNLDASTDSPASARADLLDLAQKFNQIRGYVSVYVQGLLDDADAATARATLAAAGTAVSNTFSAAQTVSAGAVDHLTLVGTDAGAAGAVLRARHDSSSPAASDKPFNLIVEGKDSGAATQIYGGMNWEITNPSAGSEASKAVVKTYSAGSEKNVEFSGGGIVTSGDSALNGAIWTTEGSNVASASSCNIWASGGNTVHVTGTTAINDFGTAPQAGAMVWCIADGAFTVNHSATINVPGSRNKLAEVNDRFLVFAETTTTFKIIEYTRVSGLPILGGTMVLIEESTFSGGSTKTFSTGIDSTFDEYWFVGSEIKASVDAYIRARISTDGGSTYKSGGTDYRYVLSSITTGATSTQDSQPDSSQISLTSPNANYLVNYGATGAGASFVMKLHNPSSSSTRKLIEIESSYEGATYGAIKTKGAANYKADTNAINAIQFLPDSGTFSGRIALYGINKNG